MTNTRVPASADWSTRNWPQPPTHLPSTMRAVGFDSFGPAEVLVERRVALSSVGPDDVLVRVAAVSVGRLLDLTARAGTHPFAGFQLPHILGAEHAGTIVRIGQNVSTISVGDHVAVFPVVTCGTCEACSRGRSEACPALQIVGVHRQGSYAEYSVVPARSVRPAPPDLGPVAAAALALAGPVAMHQLTQAGLASGDWVLIQGAASALGSLTAALAVHLGARVIATSRSATKRAALAALGATATLDPTDSTFVDDVLALTGGRGVPVAVDNLGDPVIWTKTMATLATLGTAVTSGAFLGGRVDTDLARLYLRSQRIIGVRTGTPASADRFWEEVARGFRPVVDRTFPLDRAADAHRYLEDDNNMGRVVLVVDAEPADHAGPDTREARL